MYQDSTHKVLSEYEMLVERHKERKKYIEKEKILARNLNDATLSDEFNNEAT